MFRISNIDNNKNIIVTETLGQFEVLEYQKDLSISSSEAAQREFFYRQCGTKKRQVRVKLNNSSVILSSGALQYMVGQIRMCTNVRGVGDLIGKAISGKVTGEAAIKPKYEGAGHIYLEPSYKHFILHEINPDQGALVVSDGMFYACDSTLSMRVSGRKNLSSAVLGGEGLFNLSLSGQGVVALESFSPVAELVTIEMRNDTLMVDGSYALMWSESLDFTVERSSKTLIGSAASGEGLLNVYRGTGIVVMACV